MIISYELWVMGYEFNSYTPILLYFTLTLSHSHTLTLSSGIHLTGNQVQTTHRENCIAQHGSFCKF